MCDLPAALLCAAAARRSKYRSCIVGDDVRSCLLRGGFLDRVHLMYDRAYMPIGAPKSLSTCKRFFTEPAAPRQRQYEAFRAYFVEGRPSAEVARAFGYTPGSF